MEEVGVRIAHSLDLNTSWRPWPDCYYLWLGLQAKLPSFTAASANPLSALIISFAFSDNVSCTTNTTTVAASFLHFLQSVDFSRGWL